MPLIFQSISHMRQKLFSKVSILWILLSLKLNASAISDLSIYTGIMGLRFDNAKSTSLGTHSDSCDAVERTSTNTSHSRMAGGFLFHSHYQEGWNMVSSSKKIHYFPKQILA